MTKKLINVDIAIIKQCIKDGRDLDFENKKCITSSKVTISPKSIPQNYESRARKLIQNGVKFEQSK
jgi:hypothetical protein